MPIFNRIFVHFVCLTIEVPDLRVYFIVVIFCFQLGIGYNYSILNNNNRYFESPFLQN